MIRHQGLTTRLVLGPAGAWGLSYCLPSRQTRHDIAMKGRRPDVVLLVFLAAVTALAVTATTREDAPRIVALGDSLTSGRGIGKADAYPAVLQARLEDDGYHYQVVNAGVSGDTRARALQRYREALNGDV